MKINHYEIQSSSFVDCGQRRSWRFSLRRALGACPAGLHTAAAEIFLEPVSVYPVLDWLAHLGRITYLLDYFQIVPLVRGRIRIPGTEHLIAARLTAEQAAARSRRSNRASKQPGKATQKNRDTFCARYGNHLEETASQS